MLIYLSYWNEPSVAFVSLLRDKGHHIVAPYKQERNEALLSRCDALLALPGPNMCADVEVAGRLGMPVYHALRDVPDASGGDGGDEV
jgi:hypothetical protein